MSYLKVADRRIGLLINFNVKALKSGLRRIANGFPSTVSALSALKKTLEPGTGTLFHPP